MKKIVSLTAMAIISLWLSSCTQEIKENPDEWLDNLMEESIKEKVWEWKKVIEEKILKWEEVNLEKAEKENNKETNKQNMKEVNQLEAPKTWDKIATFDTSMWIIKVKLFPEATPKTYENFVWLAEKWAYKWTIFHRVIKDFMIQWWDPEWTWMWWKSFWGTDFDDEPHPNLKNIKWALSMANKWPNTNGSQFFIVQAAQTPWLDGYQNWEKTCGQPWTSCHTVFWQVFEWIKIIDTIAVVDANSSNNKPLEDIIVNNITISDFK